MARTAAKPKPRSARVTLREDLARGLAPLAAGQARVDRELGIIYGVKAVGRSSPNTHGVAGAQGTDYTLEALREALPLYEGVAVNVDHPPRRAPEQERSARDRFAWLAECKVHDEGIFGNLHFLDPQDPLAVKMMNAAESKPDAFALSHNAVGQGQVQGGRYVVTRIPEVRSVDIVADGGTNRSLFGGKQPVKTIKLKDLVESLKKGRGKRLRRLLEMYEDAGDMDVAAPTEDAAGAEPGDQDEMDHLYQAFKKCAEDDPEKAKKILKLMASEVEGEGGGGKKKADTEESEEEDEGGEKGEAEKKETTEESRKRVKRLAKGFLNLRENEEPPAKLVAALVALPSEAARLDLLESWPRATPGHSGRAPVSAGPGTPAPGGGKLTLKDVSRALRG